MSLTRPATATVLLVVGISEACKFFSPVIYRNVLMGPAVMFNHCVYEHGQMDLSLHKIKIYVIRNNSKTS